jgi:Ca2+-binding RTX toxin-like protein
MWQQLLNYAESTKRCNPIAGLILRFCQHKEHRHSVLLDGMSGDDVIFGSAGNDFIDARAGNDIICGGFGNDTLEGGSGDDILRGNAGTDICRGEGHIVKDKASDCESITGVP